MHKKAQHIAEYMVVFEVFAVATVILITALGILPDIGWGAMVHRSDELLSIGPMGLLEHGIDECGGYALRFRSNDDKAISLERVWLGDELVFSGKKTFLSGTDYFIEGTTAHRARAGESYSLPLRVAYRFEELGSALVEKSFDDPLYGNYAQFRRMGSKASLHQKIVHDYCMLSSKSAVVDHSGSSTVLDIDGALFWALPSKYSYADLDGVYGTLSMGLSSYDAFTLEALLKVNHTSEERGIFYKPNSFYLTIRGDQLRFGVFSSGKPIVVSSSVAEDTWVVVHMVMDDKLSLYVDGALKQNVPIYSMEGSSYPLYIGTFTPESGRFSTMSLGGLLFSSRAMSEEEISKRSALLRVLTVK